MGAEMETLPLVRRVVTGHDAAGKAVVILDDIPPVRGNPSGTSLFSLIWTSEGAPVDNDDATDGGQRKVDLTLPGGSVIRVLDMLPGTVAPMHRTNSLDYGIIISGAIELILDDGVTALVEPGAVVVQRGTIHSWRNPSDTETARVAFVLLDAKPVTVNGAALPEIHPREGRQP
jgi:quercetin dioxygenase-like cupin family protein